MLEESGLLHEEPPKLFPDLQTAQTKSCTPKSSLQNKANRTPAKRTPFAKGSKQTLTSTSSSACSSQAQSSRKRSPYISKVKPLYTDYRDNLSSMKLRSLNTTIMHVKYLQVLITNDARK